jgi:hypothetical protein
LATVLSDLFLFTGSDYTFGIFKLSLYVGLIINRMYMCFIKFALNVIMKFQCFFFISKHESYNLPLTKYKNKIEMNISHIISFLGAISRNRNCLPIQSTQVHLIFSGVFMLLNLVFCVMFCRSLYVLFSYIFWRLYCLTFSYLQDMHMTMIVW